MKGYGKWAGAFLALLCAAGLALAGCGGGGRESAEDSGADSVLGSGRETLRILSGSENEELEPILENFAEEQNVRIEMTYQGSLDIMRALGREEIPYDGVWPPAACGCLWRYQF